MNGVVRQDLRFASMHIVHKLVPEYLEGLSLAFFSARF